MEASLKWVKGMQFECNNRGLQSWIDASSEHDGEGKYPSPKELVLNAMMGCSGIDVLLTLKKMRQPIEQFHIEIEAEQTEDYPVHFKRAQLVFHCSGPLDEQKLQRAVEASMTKYCGVNFMISLSCDITYRIILNGNPLKEGKASYVCCCSDEY